MLLILLFFFFKQKTAYEMRISDWSSDVCSSDLPNKTLRVVGAKANNLRDITVEFPLGISTCVTGVSGGGKSTLTIETLRSDKRRAGKEGVSTCRSRWWTET